MSSYSLGTEVVHPHCAGIDLGSREHSACAGDRPEDVRTFSAMTDGVRAMAAWFKQMQITDVVMESTGVYWITVFDVMEAAGFRVALVNAAHVHNVPGRKSDIADCQWLRKVYALGFLNDSFVPPEAVRTLRTLVRQRDAHIADQGQSVQRMQKAMDQMNVKLHTVISDISGPSGLAIVRAILGGTRDPRALLRLADVRIQKSKSNEVLAALNGIWKDVYLFTLGQALAAYEFAATQIRECNAEIEKALAAMKQSDAPLDGPRKPMQNHPMHFDTQEKLAHATGGVDLCALTGLSPHNVLQILAETGTDMSKWATGKHYTSWLSLSPPKRSSGTREKIKRRQWHPGSRAGQVLRLAALVIGRSRTALGAFYRRIKARSGAKVANVATARKLALLIYNALKNHQQPSVQSDKEYERRYAMYREKTLGKQAKILGLKLVPMSA